MAEKDVASIAGRLVTADDYEQSALWGRLCDALDGCAPSRRAAAIGSLDGVLDALPDELRAMPRRWVKEVLASDEPDPRWAVVRSLECEGRLGPVTPEEMIALVEDRGFGHLRRVLFQGGANDAVVEALAGAPHARGLAWLRLVDGTVSDAGAARLAASEPFPELEMLTLNSQKITSAGFAALAASSAFGALLGLDLEGNAIDSEGLAAFLESPLAPRLQALSLARNRLVEGDLEQIAAADTLGRLQHLKADGNDVAPKAWLRYGEHPRFRALKTFWV